jgi:hypothetical protein
VTIPDGSDFPMTRFQRAIEVVGPLQPPGWLASLGLVALGLVSLPFLAIGIPLWWCAVRVLPWLHMRGQRVIQAYRIMTMPDEDQAR